VSDEYAVGVAVTGLWRAPDAPRPIDAPLLADPPRLAEWLAGQGPARRRELWGRLDSQLLLGEPVIVHEVAGGWARVSAPCQPSSRDAAGYPGFVRWSHLAASPSASGADRVVVAAPVTAVRDGPAGRVLLPEVSFATVLPVTGRAAGSVQVRLPGGTPGWLPDADVAPYRPAAGLPAAEALVATGRRFLGLTYLAGGMHGLSFDCSGLVHALYRRFGTTVPRDARDQAALGAEVALDGADFGDLMFFTNPDTGDLYHVGICVGMPRMLQVSQTDWACIDTPLTARRRAHLSHVRRFHSPVSGPPGPHQDAD
jgi:gamma-D-glutamyl-L-lysine dipeptidyl-peptidase